MSLKSDIDNLKKGKRKSISKRKYIYSPLMLSLVNQIKTKSYMKLFLISLLSLAIISANAQKESAVYWHIKGKDAYYKRNIAEAMADFNKAIKLNPNYDTAYLHRGVIKYDKQQYKEAMDDYMKAIEINPNYADVYFNIGLIKNEMKKYKEAIEEYTKAIKLNQKDPEYYHNRGIAYKNLKRLQEAADDYSKEIDLDPNSMDGYYERAFAYVGLKMYDDADRDLKTYNKLKKIQKAK